MRGRGPAFQDGRGLGHLLPRHIQELLLPRSPPRPCMAQPLTNRCPSSRLGLHGDPRPIPPYLLDPPFWNRPADPSH